MNAPIMASHEFWPKLKDIPGDVLQLRCDVCGLREVAALDDVRTRYSPEVGVESLIRAETAECPHRQPHSTAAPCGATSPQLLATRSDMAVSSALLRQRHQLERLEREYAEVEQKIRDAKSDVQINRHNGWGFGEGIPTNSRPKYRWQRSWHDDSDDDIIGFDGTCPIGRVFQIHTLKVNYDVWFWLLYGVEGRKRWRPKHGSGWEHTQAKAAWRVEWCYERMIEHERLEQQCAERDRLRRR